MKRKILAALLSAAMVLELAGYGNVHAGAAEAGKEVPAGIPAAYESGEKGSAGREVQSKALSGKQRRMQAAQEKFEKQREKWEKEKKKQLKEMSESRKGKGKRRKKASEAEKLSVSMTELLQQDGTFREAGAGSEISINNAQDFKNLSDYTNAGGNTAGVVFKQTADIDCTGVTMCAIGVRNKVDMDDDWIDYENLYNFFSGTYDGGNHHIRNVVLDEKQVQSNFFYSHCAGLFRYISEATIQNVNLDSIDFIWPEYDYGEEDEDEGMYLEIGGIAGIAIYSVIENCTNYADITAPGYFRELAGVVNTLDDESVLRKCANYGTLDVEERAEDWSSRIAGIVITSWGDEISDCVNGGDIRNATSVSGVLNESMSCPLTGCENSGNLQGDLYTCGIAMFVCGSITNCKNSGDITAENRTASGIVNNVIRYQDTDAIRGCENSGSIRGGYAGGILARDGYTENPVNQCRNTGTVTAEWAAGGIIATCDYKVVITNCTNEGAVLSKSQAGGIVGDGENFIVSTCVNRGKVEGTNFAGGIAGKITYRGSCWNLINFGDVTSEKNAGGIVGGCCGSSIVNAWNHGTVTGGVGAGGILGTSNSVIYDETYDWLYGDIVQEDYDAMDDAKREQLANSLGNCVHVGKVSSQQAAGAMVGESNLKDRIEYCYYLEGAAQKAHGTDSEVAANLIKEWKSESFVEELNQNVASMKNGAALYMKYDSESGISWKPAVMLTARLLVDYQMEEYGITEQTVSNLISMDFALLQKSSNEYIPMTGGSGVFQAEIIQGEEYEIYRIMPDGTYNLLKENICLKEGDLSFVSYRVFNVFQVFSQVSYQKKEDGAYQFDFKDSYYTVVYSNATEVTMPAEPKKEGYIFGGWYSTPYVYNEELYHYFKEKTKTEFGEYKTELEGWYDDSEDDWEWYPNKEAFVSDFLISRFGYDNAEDLMSNFDRYMDNQYKVENPISFNYYDDLYVESSMLFAKWIDPNAAAKTPDDGGKGAGSQETPPLVYKDADPAEYMEPLGNLVQKSGVLYKVDRKKKTAQVIGVGSSSVKSIVIQSKVSSGKVSYKVTSVGKKAFAGCKKLKKITVKGNNLKKVHKTALKGANKKVVIKANKKIKKLFSLS